MTMTDDPAVDTQALPTVDVIFRGEFDRGVELRADDTGDTGSTLFGHFTRFDVWYEIDSWLEGRFLERTVAGSAKKTIRENRSTIRVAFDHGYDFFVGDSPLGPIDDLREDDEGVYYEVPLLDTDYNRDRILPMLQGRLMDGRSAGSVLGASFRFRVVKDEWVRAPKKSRQNPEALPERSITEYRLFEFGPVVYPASPTADAGARGLTDHYFERALRRSGEARSQRAARALALPSAAPGTDDTNPNPDEPVRHSTVHHDATRMALMRHIATHTTERNHHVPQG